MAVAERHHVIDRGQIVFSGSTAEIEANDDIQEKYLGVSTEAGDAFD